MTLFKQIAVLISLGFIILMSVTTWNNFRHSSQALEGQLQSAAQNMATTLGVVISNSNEDPAFVETLFNAIFDSGYLVGIELVSPGGEIIHSKTQTLSIKGVPDWLVALAPMKPATGETSIIKNWMQYGTLKLTLHPGHAYIGLYKNLKSMLIWFAALSVAGLFILWALLHITLRPLHRIRKQADAIIENRFELQEEAPATIELRHVTEAMNRMVCKVRDTFAEQTETLNLYHKQLYRDSLTGLGNRRHLISLLDDLCSEEATCQGCLVAFHISGITTIKEQKGFKCSIDLIVNLARLMEGIAGEQAHQHCTKLNKSEFALYLQDDISVAEIHAKKIIDAFRQTTVQLEVDDICYLSIGVAQLGKSSDANSIMYDIDYTLTQARTSGKYVIRHKTPDDMSLPKGKAQWRNWLNNALTQQRFSLVVQPSKTIAGTLDHNEVFVRLRDEQETLISAGIFMPMANALELDYEIELEVFRMGLALAGKMPDTPVAINVSSRFFTDAGALINMEKLLRDSIDAGGKHIQIEASHFMLTQHMHVATSIVDRIRNIGCCFGIDNVDPGLPLDLLQQLRPDYVKTKATMLDDILGSTGSADIQNLRSLTTDLDIKLIAVGIDSQQMLDQIKNTDVDGVQGYFIGKPEELS
ncbi:MAG: EAL domain-containing protein [Gammaproteobacteria bacterium]|nr:EAL domain-containing protein [Gammaproteobacteria bacterium]